MGWPEWTVIALMAISQGMVIAKHGTQQRDYDAYASAFSAVILLVLLYAGGFFS